MRARISAPKTSGWPHRPSRRGPVTSTSMRPSCARSKACSAASRVPTSAPRALLRMRCCNGFPATRTISTPPSPIGCASSAWVARPSSCGAGSSRSSPLPPPDPPPPPPSPLPQADRPFPPGPPLGPPPLTGDCPMLTKEENELLCRVEGDAAMGRLMRHHWTPVCLAEEVGEPDGAPVKARVLGEDLVVFRDSDGRVGVLAEACPHRGPSLVLGRNEEGGLRCLYHGWKMDVDGNVLEMASEPAASGLVAKTKHRAYPSREWGGMVWGWFGAQGSAPEFRAPAWAPSDQVRVSIAKVLLPCNWAQVLEGAIDSAHSSSLHSSDMVPAPVGGAMATGKAWLRPSTDKAPRLQV